MDGAVVDKDGNQLDHKPSSQEVDKLFAAGTELLKARASYFFANRKHRLWSVATWSKKVSPSIILKFGTEEDKLAIPPPKKNFVATAVSPRGESDNSRSTTHILAVAIKFARQQLCRQVTTLLHNLAVDPVDCWFR